MYPPIFELCKSNPEVNSLLGTEIVRIFPFGEAPQGVIKPYVVWQVIGGTPENYIDKAPDIDRFLVQVDAYADLASDARKAAEVVRDAIQNHAHVTSWRGESRDPDTNNYRFSFDIQFLTPR